MAAPASSERIARLRELAAAGLSAPDIAAAMGFYNGGGVHRLAKKYGIVVKSGVPGGCNSSPEARAVRMSVFDAARKRRTAQAEQLDARILEKFHQMRPGGATLLEIGVAVGCSRERVSVAVRKVPGLGTLYDRAKAPKPERQSTHADGARLGRMGRSHTAPVREALPVVTAAAQYLGRHFSKVYRADLHDNPLVFPKGNPTHYVLGAQVVPVDVMLDEARRMGFGA